MDPFWEQQPLQKVDSFYTKITFFIERYSDQYQSDHLQLIEDLNKSLDRIESKIG